MKAPDKIFLPGDIDLPSAAILTLGNQPDDVEYIRKDALLEWLKDRRAEHSFEVRKAYQRTIEKIESL